MLFSKKAVSQNKTTNPLYPKLLYCVLYIPAFPNSGKIQRNRKRMKNEKKKKQRKGEKRKRKGILSRAEPKLRVRGSFVAGCVQ